MISCTKRFDGFPFAHRQHTHEGHCKFVHGHSWSFEIEFLAKVLDDNDFVMDFGKLNVLKDFLVKKFDHTLVLNISDPALTHFKKLEEAGCCEIVEVNDCSAEGLAQYVYKESQKLITNLTKGRVYIKRVTVFEESKNSATYAPN